MFVSFISFALVLSVSVSRATGNNNVALKDQLVRSLTHVSEMLVDMENKIESERKVLSQFDNNWNQKDRLRTHPDYDGGITDIWWPSANSTGHHMDGAAITTATPGKYGNVTITVKTTASLFPRPQPKSTFATPPSNWRPTSKCLTRYKRSKIYCEELRTISDDIGPQLLTVHFWRTVAESPFIADLKQNMVLNRHGYFTAFAERFTELIYTKDEAVAYPLAYQMAILTKQHAENGTFKSLGVDLLGGLAGKLTWFESLSPQRVKEQAGVLHVMLKVIEATMNSDLKSLLKFYDNMFTKEEGEELFESLEAFYVYPEGNMTFVPIGERILDAALAPYIKSEGKRKQKRLIQHILMATHSLDPHFRAHTMSSLSLSNNGTKAPPMTDSNDSMKDHNQAALPERKSMNYKKIVKHFLIKHPKLFRKIKRQYNHDKKNEHHRFSHTRKRHHNYRKSRGEHKRRVRLYDRGQTRQRAYTESSYEPENEEVETDSSENGAYYRENSEAHQQKNIHKVQRTQLNKIRLDKLKQHTQKQRNAQQKQWNLLKGPRLTTKPYQDDPQYLKQLAIRFLRNKQQWQNFYKNRRFNVPTSEEENCNHSQNFEDSMENDMIHKIREASSYSDEENHLRNNLYDALRHGNRTFASFRKSGGDINNKQTLRALSSETDEEWVLKNNIYKVFEQEKK